MRTLVLGTVAALGFAAAALAQSSPAPVLPKLFSAYSQPPITAGLCRNVNPGQTDCIIPAMSAGLYAIHAAGTSTSQGPEAMQEMAIRAGMHSCGSAKTGKWASGARTFKLDCAISVVTDKPLTISVYYADTSATKDPKGPVVAVERMAWDGVLNATMSVPKQ